MSTIARIIVLATCLFCIWAECQSLYCQSDVIQYVNENITDMLAIESNAEAANILYKACRDSADAKSEYEQMGVSVREYKLIDLNQDGRLELVLTLNLHTTGGTAPVRVIFAGDAMSSCQKLRGYKPYGELNNAIVDLDQDGNMEIIMADWILEYQGTRPSVEWPVIYSLSGTTYLPEENRFIEYYRNLVTHLSQKIKQFDQDNPLMDSDARNRKILKWLLPMDKALRVTGMNKSAGMEEAISWSISSDIEWRKIAVELLADIESEAALQLLVGMTNDPEYPIRRRIMQKLHNIGGAKFISVYEKLLSDPYYDARTQSYPLRETASRYLRSYGIRVVGSDGAYRIEK
jgi:hypothetical protein